MAYSQQNFIAKDYKTDNIINDILIEEEAPSNIALVKYWGKYIGQLPMNPSISFTLNKSKTITKARIKPKENKSETIDFKLFFEGKHKPDFEPKIRTFFKSIFRFVPFIQDFYFEFDSKNTFPHSSGIASSASAFAALAKIIVSLEKQLINDEKSIDFWHKKASFLARLGSGSASRSIERPVTIWGEMNTFEGSSKFYAVKPDFEIHPVFNNYQDSIVLVEEGQKKVPSSVGHKLMNTHPYKDRRKFMADENTYFMLKALKNGDLKNFINIVEKEALNLHALMMTSEPNYILMQPETLNIIQKIREFRKKTDSNVCFTLDAGANVHVLYPENEKQKVFNFLKSITDKKIIRDYI